MTPTTTPSLRLSRKRVHGRAVNAIADLLRRELRVPEIYLEPKISTNTRPDVLAVDEAGSGDLHAVDVRAMTSLPTRAELRFLIEEARKMPFHYRYLAMPSFGEVSNDPYTQFAEYAELFDERGIGRVGILSFSSSLLGSASEIPRSAVRIVVRPERFRVPGPGLTSVEKFLAKATPDIAVRL